MSESEIRAISGLESEKDDVAGEGPVVETGV